MQPISEIIETKIKTKPKKNVGERHLIVGEIAKRLNETSYKKISLPLLGKMLSKIETKDLYAFNNMCIDSKKNYAACFWYSIKK